MKRSSPSSDASFFRRLVVGVRRTDRSHRGFGSWLRRRLAVGFLVAFPLVITLFFARFLFTLLDRWFRPISQMLFERQIPGLGFAIVLLVMLILGIVATNVLGSRLLDFFEYWVARLPLLSPIYQGARQITEAIQVRGEKDFRRVVLLRFPNKEVRAIGFVTREFPYPTKFADEPTALVFVPTTPNPTSGFLVVALERELETLDIAIEAGVKMVISGGVLTPTELIGYGTTPHLPFGDDDNTDQEPPPESEQS
jgi:uncharacterized membrane protein